MCFAIMFITQWRHICQFSSVIFYFEQIHLHEMNRTGWYKSVTENKDVTKLWLVGLWIWNIIADVCSYIMNIVIRLMLSPEMEQFAKER